MKTKTMKNHKGFTLIEILIVIGILAVLAVTVLLSLKPGEAQRKSRDVQRIKDLGTIVAVLDQYIADGGTLVTTLTNAGGLSTSNVAADPNCADTGWLDIDVCKYVSTVPVDPNEGVTRAVVSGTTVGTLTAVTMKYFARVLPGGAGYEVNSFMEAESNRNLVTRDGGYSVAVATALGAQADIRAEVGSNLTAL